jgi:hypothetical protein
VLNASKAIVARLLILEKGDEICIFRPKPILPVRCALKICDIAMRRKSNTTKKNGILLELHTSVVRDNPIPEREQGRARAQPHHGLAT